MKYVWDERFRLFRRENVGDFAYSDGKEVEARLLDAVLQARDRSTFSPELVAAIHDWPSEYYFSPLRHCLVRPLGIKPGDRVLEVGCGCGAITRFLGELGAQVVAVEGSLARARIAAERCRDLTNVRVFVDDFLAFEADCQFDWILLIGTLEYAARFSDYSNPYQHYLSSATRLLAAGGRVAVAIENKLGLKYFNGCGEDHVGVPFFGVQDLYDKGGVRTFGRRELVEQLSAAGLAHTYFYYPFPDYKLPAVILAEGGLSDAAFDPLDLLVRCHGRDYTGLPYRAFDDALAFSSLHSNGLLADLSNSFLVVASTEAAPPNCPQELAVAFSVQRTPDLATQTKIVRQEGQIRVRKELLLPDSNPRRIVVGNLTITEVLRECEYVPGRQLLWRLLKARSASGEVSAVVEALRPWMEFLLRHTINPIVGEVSGQSLVLESLLLPADFMDCTPFNLLEDGGELVAIDLEWLCDAPVPLGWVVTRGVLWCLAVGVPIANQVQSITEVIESLCNRSGILVAPTDIQRWVALEVEFQEAVTGRAFEGLSTATTSSGLRPYSSEIRSLQEAVKKRDEYIDGVSRETITKDAHIADLSQQLRHLLQVTAEQEAHIGGLTEQVRELQQVVADRDAHILNLGEQIADRDAQIVNRDAQIANRDAQIANLEAQIERSETQIATLDQLLAHTRQELEATGYQLQQETSRKEQLRWQLGMIEASTSWRVVSIMRAALAPYPRLRHWARRVLRLGWWTLTLQLPKRILARARLFRAQRIVARSELFDAAWYLKTYPDVAEAKFNPALHYTLMGAQERRNPGPSFDTGWYLDHNPDVAKAGVNPLVHYVMNGSVEGRQKCAVSDADQIAGASLAATDPEQMAAAASDYQLWVSRYDTINENDASAIRLHLRSLRSTPLISVVMPVYNTRPPFLRNAIESVIAQLYPDWELCIADDASTDAEIRTILQEYERRDHRIKAVYRTERGHIAAASNSAIALARGEFIALMDHDDELPVHALFMVAVELNEHPEADLIYSDEDRIDADGHRHGPYFKTEWNPELFYSQNMINHLGVYRTSLVQQIGGFREGFDGSQDYDLALRVLGLTTPERVRHIPHVLYHWRLSQDVQTFSTGNMPIAVQAAHRAIAEYFASCGKTVQVTNSSVPYWNRLIRTLPDPPPLVTLIVPTRDRLAVLRTCIDGLLHKTRYPSIEIILVDNESREPATLKYLDSVQADSRVRVLRIKGAFNFSALNNQASAAAHGKVIGFINNDIEVIDPGWLGEMVTQVMQEGVGAVGAKLCYGDNTIQHAGVVLGMTGIAGHAHKNFPRNQPGYYGWLQLIRNVSCVTAACMIIRKDVFAEVGGFDEENLPVAYNDVDLCLKIRRAGYSIVWTPYAELYHQESVSRGSDQAPENVTRAKREFAYMKEHWGAALENDAFYNPNLSLAAEAFSLAFPPRVDKPWRAGLELNKLSWQFGTAEEAQQAWNNYGHNQLHNLLSNNRRISCNSVQNPTLSVILVLHNKAHLSLLAIDSIRENADVSYELIVIDNGSSDETPLLLDRIDGALIIRNAANAGFGPACMQGAEKAHGDYLCFFNNDALLQRHGFSSALANLANDPSVGAVGGKILLAHGALQEAGSLVWSDGTALGYGRGDNADLPQYNFRRPVDFCSGAFLFTPRALFVSLGGFGADYAPAYYEDADYCMKVWREGRQVIYEPGAVIRHYESASSGNNDAARHLMAANQHKFVANWKDELQNHLPRSQSNIIRGRIAAADRRRHVLYIEDSIPHSRLGAGNPRSNAVLHQIVKQGYRVTCAATSFAVGGNEYTDIPAEVELLDATRDTTHLVNEYFANCDILWICRPNNMERFQEHAAARRARQSCKVIYDAEAIFAERDYWKSLLSGEAITPKAFAARVAREVAPAAKVADAIVCVSERDSVRLATSGITNQFVVAHHVEPRPTSTPFQKRCQFLFVGRMHGGGDPNSDSMRYFCDLIWPHVRRMTGQS